MNNWIEKLKMRLPALVLLAATMLFWGFYERFESAGPVLLESPTRADASRLRGNCSEEGGGFVLSVVDPKKTARINFPIPGATEYERIRIRGRIKVEGVVKGKYGWSCARLLLSQYDQTEKWLPGQHTLKAESGTSGWKLHENVFEVMPDAAHVDLVLQQIGLAGTAGFDQLTAEPVRFRPSFIWWRSVFAVLWFGMGILYFRRCRLDRRKLRLLILLNGLAILSGSLMPEQWIEGITSELKEVTARTSAKDHSQPTQSVEKIVKKPHREAKYVDLFNDAVGTIHQTGHFLLFASLCFLLYLSAALERQHRIYFFKVAFDLLLFATITESLQYLTIDRTPGITDWLTDVYGMLAAFLLFLIVLGIHRFFNYLKRVKYV